MYNAGIIVTKNIITDLSAGCELNKEIVIMTKITDINTIDQSAVDSFGTSL